MKIELRELYASYLLEGDIMYVTSSDSFTRINSIEYLHEWILINQDETPSYAFGKFAHLSKDILVFRERTLPEF